jgi:hypothetical protein
MRNTNRGEIVTLVLLILVLVGGAAMVVKPKFLSGETKRAEESARTTRELVATFEKKESLVAADVTTISEVSGSLPASKEKDFVRQESRLVLSRLRAPDPEELLKSSERANAVLQGELKEANKLYADAAGETKVLLKEIEKVKGDKDASDLKLQTVAAAHLATERQRNIAIIAVIVFGLLWFYVSSSRPSPGAIATAVNDMRSGTDPVTALDGVTTRFEQTLVRFFAKLRK